MEVMIVEDERITALAAAKMVAGLGHHVIAHAPSAELALEALERLSPDVIFMDIHLEGEMDGIEAGAIIKRRWDLPVAYASAYADDDTRRRAAETDPVAFIVKPLNLASFREFFANFRPRGA